MKSTGSMCLYFWLRIPALAVTLICAAPAWAQLDHADNSLPNTAVQSFDQRYPAGSVISSAQADQALRDARAERVKIDARFTESDRACRGNFFMTACLLEAKEQRCAALQRIKTIEVEANTYKRQSRVDARNATVAARQLLLMPNTRVPSDILRVGVTVPMEATQTNKELIQE